jgi:glucose-1-phosphate thymidylyltransferase
VVILGDNIFFDPLTRLLTEAEKRPDDACIILTKVDDPSRYGVAELRDQRVVSIEEKPAEPKSNLAVVGVYVYPPDVFSVVKGLKPSGRGELEITDVNRYYLDRGRLGYSFLEGYWTDAGTLPSLAAANRLVLEQPPLF